MRKKLDDKTDDGFLSRWSSKKSQSDQLPEVIDEDVDNTVETQKETDVDNALPEQQLDDQEVLLTDADMPDIEELDEKSDYSGFLSPGVSDQLRKLALRKLFRSEKFNIRDGLDDYDDDFRNFAALGDIITCDMKHQQELAEQREQQRQAEEELAQSDQEQVDHEMSAEEELAQSDQEQGDHEMSADDESPEKADDQTEQPNDAHENDEMSDQLATDEVDDELIEQDPDENTKV